MLPCSAVRRHPTSTHWLSAVLCALSIQLALGAAFAQADHDKDGVPDQEDDCPTDPGHVANAGCPGDPPPAPAPEPLVEVSASKVEIKKSIEFESGSAKLRPTAEAILKAVAEAMARLPAGTRVKVRGHTDAQGSRASNLRLSAKRAEAVRERLYALGVEKGRLDTEGVGPLEPIASNDTEQGRGQNRRVEFVILDEGGKPR